LASDTLAGGTLGILDLYEQNSQTPSFTFNIPSYGYNQAVVFQSGRPKITKIVVRNIIDPAGLAYDNFKFTLNPDPTRQPIGFQDNVDSNGNATGWSLDPDSPSQSNTVHFYIDGPAGTGTFIGSIVADVPRPDVNQATGYPGNHGYSFSIPNQYRDGTQHTLYAYGIDLVGNNQPFLLSSSPKTFTLYPPLQSVIFEPINGVSVLDTNPNIGGGLRIFPDAVEPDEQTNRRRVRVKATLVNRRAGVTIYYIRCMGGMSLERRRNDISNDLQK